MSFSFGNITPAGLNPNQLLDLQTLANAPQVAADVHQNRMLAAQTAQQGITEHDIAMTGQAAAPLLNMSEDDAAKAYPGWLQDQQSRGLAKYAPPTYPGHAAVQALVQRAMPLMDQFKIGYITPSGTQAAIDAALRPGGGAGTTAGGTTAIGGADTAPINAAGDSRTRKAAEGGPPAPGTPGAATARQVHDFWISKGFSEPVVAGIMAGGPGSESDFNPAAVGDKGTSIGLYQHHGPRADAMRQFFGLSGSQMPSADQQNQYANWEITQGPLKNVGEMLKTAKTPAEAAAIWTQYFGVPADKTEIGRRAAGAQRFVGLYGQPQQGGPGGTTAAAPPPGVQMGGGPPPPPGGATGPYTGGGMGAVLAPGGPGGRRLTQAERLGGTEVAGPPMVASTNPTAAVPTTDQMATPARYAGTTPAPPAEAPPEAGWGTQVGSGYGSQNALAPAPVPPAPAQPAAQTPPPPAQQQPPPGARANLPRAADIPTGVNSQQYRDAADLQRRALILEAQVDPTGRLKQLAGGLRQQAQLLLQTDSVVQTQEGQLHPLTGQIGDPTKPLADYRETSPGSGIWVGGPGTEPRFQPPGRLVVDPAGNVWQTSVGGAHMLAPSDPAALAARKAAEAAGTAAGTAAGKLPEQLANQGRDATQAIGNIDYGMSQIAKAKAGGVPTGYFAPWLGTIAAVGKSLGIPTEAIGVNPAAVGNIQTAQKTLAVVSGAILQQVLGSDSQITDAKIQHFIHAQPGIETDPEALSRVLNWARSQFVYEQEMARQGMKDASGTGMLPNNWRARYFTEHGFAPIYNPGTGEMQQPDGGSPSREPPATVTTAPVNPAARQVGTIYSTPKGPMKWIGNGWVAP